MNAPAIPQWDLFLPLDGVTSMLELGNKVTGAGLVYKSVFEARGIRHVSVDWNGKDGALPLDLRQPLNLGRFDMVTNFGTSEHVENNQQAVWQNIIEATDKILICSTPKPGDWKWHGQWYPTAEFYCQLAALNGFQIERLCEAANAPRRLIQCRMVRIQEKPFTMPESPLLFNDVRGQRRPNGRRNKA